MSSVEFKILAMLMPNVNFKMRVSSVQLEYKQPDPLTQYTQKQQLHELHTFFTI